MYLAYKYVKKRKREREQAKAAEEARPQATETQPQDGVLSDDTWALTASRPTSAQDHPAPISSTPAEPESKPKETPEERAEKKRRRAYRLKIILGLFAPFTLQALDTTIIASALKFIADDFNQLAQLNWIITAFNLTSATSLPLFAQLADTFGRHATLQTAIVIITIGSALCTAAPTTAFPLLLFGRALQGVGAAGINICVRTVLADRVSLKEYAKNWTVFALVSGISFSIGPVAGGYLTKVSWRWCFAVNLPVGVVGILLVWVLLRGELVGPRAVEGVEGAGEGVVGGRRTRFWDRLATVDYGGQLLFLWGFGLLVLAFTWAGGTYSWGSVQVLAPLVVGAVLAAAWLVYEWAMVPGRVMSRVFPRQKAMMPWEMLMQRDIGLLMGVNFATGTAMFAIMYFMDLYFTLVQGHDAGSAGLALLYFLPGLGVGAYASMFFINVWPRQTVPVLFLGTTGASVGLTVIAWACQADQVNLIYGMMALTGFGVGLIMNPGSLHALAYFPDLTAPITFLVSFAFPFGGTISLTIMSTVFNNRSGTDHSDPKSGIMWAYVSVVPIMWLAVLNTTFLGNVWIGKDGNHEVVHGAWFWGLLRGKKFEKVTMARVDPNESTEKGVIELKAVAESKAEPGVDVERGK